MTKGAISIPCRAVGHDARNRQRKTEGDRGTLLLLFDFFTFVGALGVYVLLNPRSVPFYFPVLERILGNLAGILVALFLLWASVTGLRFTLQEWRGRR